MSWLRAALRLGQIGKQLPFAVGLSAQKGAPILLAPLVIQVGGVEAYGSLIYALALCQFWAMVMSLGVPQIIIPLWHSQASALRFARHSALLLAMTSSVVGLAVVLPAVMLFNRAPPGFDQVGFALSVVFIALGLNALNWSTQVARALQKGWVFFAISLGGPLALVALLLFYRGAALIAYLLMAHGVVALVSPVLLARSLRDRALETEVNSIDRSYTAAMFRQSLTLFGYSIATVSVINIDKIILNHYFDMINFAQYAANLQLSFSILIVPTVINFIALPLISQNISSNRKNMAHRILIFSIGSGIIVSFLASGLIYAYALLTKIPIDSGFFILCAGFILHGIYIQNSGLQMARQRFGFLLRLNVVGATLFFIVIFAAILKADISIAYWAWPAYSMFLLGTNVLLDRRRKRVGGLTAED